MLSLEFSKLPSLNPTHSMGAFQQYQEHAQIVLYNFSFDLNELSMKKSLIVQ
jgi:hypothetical protein